MTSDRESRQDERRSEIIQAARRCFRQKGLHTTSMADIAREARLGPGQIYRCFQNKDAIVEAIIEDIIAGRVQHMLAVNHNLVEKAGEFTRGLAGIAGFDSQDDALLLEINAEAARNPRIAELMIRADQTLFHEGCRMMKRHYPELNETQIQALSEIMAVLTEGTLARRHIRPARGVDAQTLQRSYLILLNALFPGEPETLSDKE